MAEIEFRDVLNTREVDDETTDAVKRTEIQIEHVSDMETDGDGLHFLNNRGVYREVTGEGIGDMNRHTYDKNINGVVDNSELVNGLTVETAVPVNAKFTDTIYNDYAVTAHIQDRDNPHEVSYDDIQGDQPTPIDHTHTEDDITDLVHYTDVDADTRIQNAIQDGISSISTLYSSNKIESLIESSLIYQGQWNADTNTPTLIDGTGTKGYFYGVSVAGTQDLGNGPIDFNVNDKITYDGTNWNRSTSSANVDWGNISGILSNQVDLQTALDLKTDDTVFDAHTADTTNPHSVTKAQVGLPNVPDTIAQDLADHETDFTNPHLTTVSNLGDTSVTDASEGQRLSYNETTGLWEPRNSVSGLGFVVFDYNFDTDVTATPVSGRVQMNNVDPTLATELYFHSIDRTGKDVDAYWSEIKEGDWFNVYRSNDTTRFYAFDAIGSATQNGSVWTVPVSSYLVEGTAIGDGNRVKVLWRISQTQVIDNLVTPRADLALSANQGVVLKADVDTKVEWKGPWVGATYYENDMVRDGAYTMIANKETTDRPSPQDVGYGGYVYSGTLTPYQQNAKQIIFGTRYVVQTPIKLTGYRVDVIAGNEYHLYSIMDPLGDAIVNHLHSFVADIDGWISIASVETIIGNGLTFDVICEVVEPAGTPTVTAFDYDYDTPNNVTAPASGQIVHANNDVAYLHINHTDNNTNDNTAFLQGLTVGDIIELDNVRWSIQGIVNNPSYVSFQISPAIQYGNDGVHSFNFETVTATPITVRYELDYNLTYPMSGLYIVDGKYVDIVPDDNQYGIDIEVQEISISSDWEIVATSASTGSGGEGGATIEIVDDLVTQDSSKALSANQGYVLDNAKVANGRVLTDVPGGAVFTDTIYNDSAIQSEVDLNTAKVTNVDHPLVETAVPVGAEFTDTVYDDTTIQSEVDLNTLKETNIIHPSVEKAVPSNAKFTDTVYTHPTTAGNIHMPSGGSVGQVIKNIGNGSGSWQDESGGGVGLDDITYEALNNNNDVGTGSTQVARGSHTHTGYDNYEQWRIQINGGPIEPVVSYANVGFDEGTALNISNSGKDITFSVDLGTGSTQAAYGNHNHDGVYSPILHNHDAEYEITSGSNSSGNWIKYPDGTMMQWGSSNQSSGGIGTISFPLAFSNTPTVTLGAISAAPDDTVLIAVSISVINALTCTFHTRYASGGAVGATDEVTEWIAVGKYT